MNQVVDETLLSDSQSTRRRGASRRTPGWQSGPFTEQDTDPLAGFANIMDVMLVFAVGLMLALISQSQELQAHFNVERTAIVTEGKELVDAPDSIKQMTQSERDGMKSLGQVYQDPKTGKLILIGSE